MPVLALYEFDDTGAVVRDTAPLNGAQDGAYMNGATPTDGMVYLDGVDDFAKIYADDAFQMDRGTLEIRYTQNSHVGSGPETVLSRDSIGQGDGGGFRIEQNADGSISVSHETATGVETLSTAAGFATPGQVVNISYSWDLGGEGGALVIDNLTTGDSFTADVPNTVSMDMGSLNQNWIIGAGQSLVEPGDLRHVDQHFHGVVKTFQISDTVDNKDGDDDDDDDDGDDLGAPVANPDTAETDEDTPVTIDVTGNDTGGPLTVTTATAENGTVTINDDNTITYTPNPDYNGPDTITYTIENASGGSSTSTCFVTVNPVNDDPVANPDTASTSFNTPVTIPVLANDTDVDGDPLSVLGTPTSADGDVVVNDDGSITFTPTTGFSGTTTIEYVVTDGQGGTATGIVTVTVGALPPPPPPTGPDGYVDGTPGPDLIDADYDGDPNGDFIDNEDAILPGDGPNDDRVRAGGGDDTVEAGLGNDTVFGGDGNDSIVGGPGDDVLHGESGDDTLIGGPGNDLVFSGEGDDFVDTRGGTPLPDRGYPGLYPADENPFDDRDTVYGDDGNDTIYTGDDNDLVYGGAGADYVDAGFDDDTVYGGTGDDTLIGGEGSDSLFGDEGDDLIYGGLSPEFPDEVNIPDDTDLRPDNGQDTIYGGDGNDTVFGLDDNDVIYGGAGDDSLDGGIDNDVIYGGDGNDTITGGDGADTLYGGADRDLFIGVNEGDFIDGNEEGDDYDTLDLRGAGPLRVAYDPENAENGEVTFFDGTGTETGRLAFINIENVIPCFTPGTMIATPTGERPVEDLRMGDKIITRDNGIQEIRWVGRKDLDQNSFAANPHLRPVLIRQGSLGNGLPERDMLVSPNHRVLIANDRTALYFDEHEVLVAAKHLVGTQGVAPVSSAGTAYIHFMFDRHEVVLSNGAWTESFQPGDYTLRGMGNAQRNEIFELFPELKQAEGLQTYTSARKTLRRHEAVLLTR